MLVDNAGVAHYMPFTELPADKAMELHYVKVIAPTMLARATAPGMVARREGTIINVSGMLAFSGPAPMERLPLRRAVYTGSLAHIVALSQALREELRSQSPRIQALCPRVVATKLHERQGLDLSAVPCMSADDVVTAGLRGLAVGEVLCAPGVERSDLLDARVGQRRPARKPLSSRTPTSRWRCATADHPGPARGSPQGAGRAAIGTPADLPSHPHPQGRLPAPP